MDRVEEVKKEIEKMRARHQKEWEGITDKTQGKALLQKQEQELIDAQRRFVEALKERDRRDDESKASKRGEGDYR